MLVDKPAGMTSHDVVARLRRVYCTRRVGHAGTLDPMATGLLVVCVGWATRLADRLTGDHKAYHAEIRLGVTTTTDDAEGQTIYTRPVPELDAATLEAVCARYRGTIRQVPPQVSAIHVDGQRAHALVRAGVEFSIPSREVEVTRFDVRALAGDRLEAHCIVSAGTYIRALARDLGEDLECGGHLTALRRVSSGPWSVDAAHSLEELEASSSPWDAGALTPWEALNGLVAVELDDHGVSEVRFGRRVAAPPDASDGTELRLGRGGELVAIGQVVHDARGAMVQPVRVVPVEPGD